MLQIIVPEKEFFNEETSEFINVPATILQLEHSLISLSKWESKWCKPFLSDTNKTGEELLDYVRCMTITQKVDPMVYAALTTENFKEISDYINAPMTATWFNNREGTGGKRSSEAVTSELIYYWMIYFGIPVEFEKWHLNRLLTLVRVCEVKNSQGKKMSKKDIYSQNRALNEARRKAHHSVG